MIKITFLLPVDRLSEWFLLCVIHGDRVEKSLFLHDLLALLVLALRIGVVRADLVLFLNVFVYSVRSK